MVQVALRVQAATQEILAYLAAMAVQGATALLMLVMLHRIAI
jgi:hypothetical protein